ncbi:MAG: Uma2 family endonuclease [Minicystis sp.]
MSPPASSSASSSHRRPAGPRRPLPPVDERLVAPETRYEIIDGKVEYVAPADEPHGTRHSKISALLEAYAADGFDVASDMLTRTSEGGDMAPDASVFPAARDPETGGRQIEQLAFEVVSTERLSHAAKKARNLVARGVRRVFAVDVERRRALAWSTETNSWEILPSDGAITDPALALPLPIRPLVEAARADDAIAAALIAKKNPVITAAIEEGKVRGRLQGKVAALLAILSVRKIEVRKKARKQIETCDDESEIDRWLARAVTASTLDDVLGA